MSDPVEHFYTRVRARAYIKGAKDATPISDFHVRYELNAVPQARVSIPIGRRGDDFSVSEAESLVSGLSPYTQLRLELEPISDPSTGPAPQGKDPGFPQGPVDVFDGFISGAAYTRDRSSKSVALSIGGFGKFGALAGATRFSDGLVIGGQHNGDEYVSTMISKKHLGFLILNTLLDAMPGIADALWENGLFPLFNMLIDQASDVFSAQFGYKTGGGSSLALQALSMITAGNQRLESPDMTLRSDYQALTGLRKSMVRSMAQLFYGWAARGKRSDASLLDLLGAAARTFLFTVVPCVKDVAVVPLFFNLQEEPEANRVIDPSEYWSIASEPLEFTPDFWSYVTTVALTSGFDLSEERTDSPIVSRPIGVGTVNDRPLLNEATGRMLTDAAPSWALPYSPPPGGSVLEGIPDLGSLAAYTTPPSSDASESMNNYVRSGLGDAIAETILHSLLFKGRRRNIAGRLRLDLAPGTLVKLNTAGEKFTGVTNSFYGIVGAVDINVSDQGGHGAANTTLRLTHLRTEEEHAGLTLPVHPLYTSGWSGGRLIEY